MINLIAATSLNSVIGTTSSNSIPWKSSRDLRLFKTYTVGKNVLMGRSTWESLGCKPLPNRHNIILTSKESSVTEDLSFVGNIACAMALAEISKKYKDLWIIGGAKLYKEVLDLRLPEKLVISRFPFEVEGDVLFPEIPSDYILTDIRNVDNEFHVYTYKLSGCANKLKDV